MLTILVTGGAGFLGSHLCERLLSLGNRIVCVDNLSSGAKENIAHLVVNPNFSFVFHDVNSPLNVDVDQIYHLACPASPDYYQRNPVQTTRTCIQGSLNMLDLANRKKVPILQASTSEIYGDPEIHPQTEAYWGRVNPIGIRSCYNEGKRCAESLFFDYRRQYALTVKVARIFNTYGPRMQWDDGRVIPNFIEQALSGGDLTIYGNGSQSRSFCYVDDMIEGLIVLMEKRGDLTGPVNLGNPDEVSMFELAGQIIALTGSPSRRKFLPLPEDDPRKRKPDITLARRELGWTPTVEREAGLRNTIDFFRRRYL
jgi:UDP-glucuronate decarboxylase